MTSPAAMPVRRMMALAAAVAMVSALFVLSFGYAQHAPRPHHLRIDVVAAGNGPSAVRAALARAVPGGFDVRPVATEPMARQQLEHMRASGALIVPPTGSMQVLTAGAAGVPLQQLVDRALGAVAAAQGRQVQFADVVPLPGGDRAGGSAFTLELGLLIPSVLGAIGFFLMGRRTRVQARVAAAAVYVVVGAALAVLVLDVALGALTGAPWALFGDAVLIAATFVLSVVALHCLVGLAGTGIAAAALIVVGNAVNGAAVPTALLPQGYRQIAPWLPNNAAVHLVRSDLYFGGHGQSGPLLTLLLWLAVSSVVVIVTDLVHLRLRRTIRETTSVYGTSLAGHLRARATGKRLAT